MSAKTTSPLHVMKVFDIEIPALTSQKATESLHGRKLIFTPNPEILLQARENPDLKKAIQGADLLLPDGNGLLFVSTLLQYSKFWRRVLYWPALILFLFWKKPFKKDIPEVIHGSDFMEKLIAWSEQNNKSVFFLGAGPGVAEKTATVFASRHPKLKIAGSSSSDPSQTAFDLVEKSRAQVLFVAYGAPNQEVWLSKHWKSFGSVEVAMGVGGSFDFWSGNIKRAPDFMRKMGLEWLFRLAMDPLRRTKRIWNALFVFPRTCLFASSSLPEPSPNKESQSQ
jgi:N-acetylglucosaminyldiphosphoundecaprenol N-acetyl-beta-D-mannosaminyltransferase